MKSLAGMCMDLCLDALFREREALPEIREPTVVYLITKGRTLMNGVFYSIHQVGTRGPSPVHGAFAFSATALAQRPKGFLKNVRRHAENSAASFNGIGTEKKNSRGLIPARSTDSFSETTLPSWRNRDRRCGF